jgi:transposase InsO family protein
MGAVVLRALERAATETSLPKTIRLDNGPEFVGKDLDLWMFMRGVTPDFSRPGEPTDDAYIESFNGKFCAARLNTTGSSASTRRGKKVWLGRETIATFVRVLSRLVLELADASSGDMRLSDHAARSMI